MATGATRADRVLVVGAGVVGLSCAIRLAEAGHDVHVLARDLPAETTSATAAAIWRPYRAEPAERVAAWAGTTYAEYARLVELAEDPDVRETGVRMRWGTELLADPTQPRPEWTEHLPHFEQQDNRWRFRAPVIDMRVYLRWLVARLHELGGTLTRQALPALPNTAGIVVNASGIAARHLAGDRSVTPLRGQVVVVEQIGLTEWTVREDPLSYVIPRLNEIVLGGTSDPGEWSPHPDPATAERILADAEVLVPGLAEARVLHHRVGLRPARPAVRLEPEHTPDGRLIVHCYGHGGSGVTVSWGCADDVAALVSEHT